MLDKTSYYCSLNIALLAKSTASPELFAKNFSHYLYGHHSWPPEKTFTLHA